jgi:RNA recognition motif-containing protein
MIAVELGDFNFMNIYVGNLSYEMNEEDLRSSFEDHGGVYSAKIIMDRETGRSKGFGFVEMPDESEATAAIRELNEAMVNGRPLKVNEAKPRREFNQERA